MKLKIFTALLLSTMFARPAFAGGVKLKLLSKNEKMSVTESGKTEGWNLVKKGQDLNFSILDTPFVVLKVRLKTCAETLVRITRDGKDISENKIKAYPEEENKEGLSEPKFLQADVPAGEHTFKVEVEEGEAAVKIMSGKTENKGWKTAAWQAAGAQPAVPPLPEPEKKPAPPPPPRAAAPAPAGIDPLLSHLRTRDGKIKITVVDFDAKGVDKIISESITQVVASEIGSFAGTDVITRQDVEAMLGMEEKKQLMGCTEIACMAEIGGALGVDYLVAGSVSLLAGTHILAIQLIDTQAVKAEGRESVSWSGSAGDLTTLVRPYVLLLFGKEKAQQFKGNVEIIASQPEASVHVDGKAIGTTPLRGRQELAIGKHAVEISKPGYVSFNSEFVVNRAESTVISARLISEEELKPWYAKWWIWTLGSAVAGGAVLSAVLLTGGQQEVAKGSGTITIKGPDK